MKKNILQITNYIGVILLAISIVWWLKIYGFNFDYIRCFAYSDGICRASTIDKVFVEAGYSPVIFWISIVCLVTGYGLKKI